MGSLIWFNLLLKQNARVKDAELETALQRTGEKWVVLLATGCYAGYLPVAPGTFGTLAAVPLSFLVSLVGPLGEMVFAAAFASLAVWIAGKAERIFNAKDSSFIVIDEMAGFLVTLLLIPWNAETVLAGFILFRVMDIAKPFPIRRLESKWPGGWGVVGDDVLAGVYANLALRALLQFY
jgi:phosphatidylglycerophosphatase A